LLAVVAIVIATVAIITVVVTAVGLVFRLVVLSSPRNRSLLDDNV